MKKASLRFELRTDRSTNGKHPIVVKLYANGKNKYITTLFKLKRTEWSKEKERAVYNIPINTYLDEISTKFNRFLLDHPTCINLEVILANVLNNGNNNQITLISYMEDYLLNKKLKKDVIAKTLSRYERLQVVIISFLKTIKKPNLLLASVNLEFINQWDTYIKSTLKHKENKLGQNTLNKYHSLLRTILLQAYNEGILKTNPYSMYKLKAKPTKRCYLSEKELQILMGAKFDQCKNEKVRLIYLFSCYTGIRFEDAQQLTSKNITQNADGKYCLSFISAKANKQQEIPLLDDAVAVIEEMESTFQTELGITKKLLPKISNQKFNDYLKVITAKVGIDKDLTHHTARHTFATYMLGRGVSPQALQVLLGHSNLRETMIYAKITPGYLSQEVEKGNNIKLIIN